MERMEKLHQEIMDRLENSSIMLGGENKFDRRLNEHSLPNYISMAICQGLDTYTVQELIKSHSTMTRERILSSIEYFMEEQGTEKRPKLVTEPKKKGRKAKPVIYNGVVYPSPQALADATGNDLNHIRYWIKIGRAEYKA